MAMFSSRRTRQLMSTFGAPMHPTRNLQPPKVTFTTRIYHCNVDNNGKIWCLMLKDMWSPGYTLETVSVLASPPPVTPTEHSNTGRYRQSKILRKRSTAVYFAYRALSHWEAARSVALIGPLESRASARLRMQS